jgi:uncharacterized membrane protein YqjE
MKRIIFMELVLIAASVLIFRSIWAFLDKWDWASTNVGQGVLLVIGVVVSIFALRQIQFPNKPKSGDPRGD